MDMTEVDHDLQRWRSERLRRASRPERSLSLHQLSDAVLTFAAALALFRGTQMWLGYPTSQSEFTAISPLPMQLMIYTLLALTGLTVLTDWRTLRAGIRGVNGTLIVALIFMMVSIVASVDVAASVRGALAVFSITAPLLLYGWRFGTVGSIQLLRNFAACAVFLNIAYAVMQPQNAFMTGSLAGTMRGLFVHKNIFGQVMALYLIVLLPSPAERPWLQWPVIFRTVACVGAIGCLIASRSSTAIVQAGIGMICLAFATGILQIRARNARSYVVFLAFLSVLALFFFSGLLIASIVAEGVGKDLTLSGRTIIWGALLPHALDYPFTGYGFSMLRNPEIIAALTEMVPWGVRSTHNTYIELLLNIGIPGALAWFVFLLSRVYDRIVSAPVTAMGRMARNRHVAIMLMILLGSFTEAGQMLAPLAMWTILASALPQSGELLRRTREAAPSPSLQDRRARAATRLQRN